jgi:hypothetical protein
MILEPESPRILTNDLDILPPQSCKSFPSYLAKRWREVDKIDAGEKLWNGDEF